MTWNRFSKAMARGTAASSVGGTDTLPVMQSGSDKVATIAQTRASPTFTGTVTLPSAVALGSLTDAANDAAAASAGVAVGRLYRNGSVLMVRIA